MKNIIKHIHQHTEAVTACETYLNEQKEYNISHDILCSETKIIDRMVYRRLELFKFYNEIYSKLETEQWKRVTDIVLFTSAFWNPEKAEITRNAKKKLVELNRCIHNQAESLAKLLYERYQLSEKHGLNSYDKYHIAVLIDEASENNGLYRSYLKKPLRRLVGQYDLKYWPSLSKVVEVIANDAGLAKVEATDSITAANISSSRNSLSDYLKAFYQAMDESKASQYQSIPDEFELSDDSLASIVNCVLDLSEDKFKDANYVKSVRQNIRETLSFDNN